MQFPYIKRVNGRIHSDVPVHSFICLFSVSIPETGRCRQMICGTVKSGFSSPCALRKIHDRLFHIGRRLMRKFSIRRFISSGLSVLALCPASSIQTRGSCVFLCHFLLYRMQEPA